MQSADAWLPDNCTHRFSSADYWCFQVSNPCHEIHSAAFVDHTPLTK